MCGKKVFVMERHMDDGVLHHRSCIRAKQRADSKSVHYNSPVIAKPWATPICDKIPNYDDNPWAKRTAATPYVPKVDVLNDERHKYMKENIEKPWLKSADKNGIINTPNTQPIVSNHQESMNSCSEENTRKSLLETMLNINKSYTNVNDESTDSSSISQNTTPYTTPLELNGQTLDTNKIGPSFPSSNPPSKTSSNMTSESNSVMKPYSESKTVSQRVTANHHNRSSVISNHNTPSRVIANHNTPTVVINHNTHSRVISNHSTPTVVTNHNTPSKVISNHNTPSRVIANHNTPTVVTNHNTPSRVISNHNTPSRVIANHNTPTVVTNHNTPSRVISNHSTPTVITNHNTPSRVISNHNTPSRVIANHNTPTVVTKHNTPAKVLSNLKISTAVSNPTTTTISNNSSPRIVSIHTPSRVLANHSLTKNVPTSVKSNSASSVNIKTSNMLTDRSKIITNIVANNVRPRVVANHDAQKVGSNVKVPDVVVEPAVPHNYTLTRTQSPKHVAYTTQSQNTVGQNSTMLESSKTTYVTRSTTLPTSETPPLPYSAPPENKVSGLNKHLRHKSPLRAQKSPSHEPRKALFPWQQSGLLSAQAVPYVDVQGSEAADSNSGKYTTNNNQMNSSNTTIKEQTNDAVSPMNKKSILKTALSTDSNSSETSNGGTSGVVKRTENTRRKPTLDDILDPMSPKNNMSAFNICDSIDLAHTHTGYNTQGSWQIEMEARSKFGSSSDAKDSSGMTEWQLEAEKRRSTGNGRYVDHEMCPNAEKSGKMSPKTSNTTDFLEEYGVFFNSFASPCSSAMGVTLSTPTIDNPALKSCNNKPLSPTESAMALPPNRSISPPSVYSTPIGDVVKSYSVNPTSRSGNTSPTSGYISPRSGFTSPRSDFTSPRSGYNSSRSGYASPTSVPTLPISNTTPSVGVFSSHKSPSTVQLRNKTVSTITSENSTLEVDQHGRKILHPERISFTEELHPDSVTRKTRSGITREPPSWIHSRPQPLPPTKSTPKRRVCIVKHICLKL